MKYILLLLSVAVAIYEYYEDIKKTKDIKTFVVIVVMLCIANVFSFSLKYLSKYSLIQIFSTISRIILPWYIEFMET